jgi:hypothetical protein
MQLIQKLSFVCLVTGLALSVHAADMEVFAPDEPSRIEHVKDRGRWITIQFWGCTEAKAPIRLGHQLRQARLTPGQAETEIWKVAWQTYPDHRFFARAFVTVATDAFEGRR